MVNLFLRFESLLSRLAMIFAVLMLIVSVSMGFYQVITRFVFDAPSTWSEVLARTSMIWCVFMGAAVTFRGGYMMSVEVIYKLMPAKWLIFLECLIVACCVTVLAILIYYGCAMTWRVRFQTLSGLGISIAWAYAAIPTGAAFSLLAVLARLCAQIAGREAIGSAEADMPSTSEQSQVAEPSTQAQALPQCHSGSSAKLIGKARP